MIGYSLSGQDDWVLSMLNKKQSGVFLDLGCGNGIEFNNTYKLELEYGWSGVCVDKNINLWTECSQNRSVVVLNKEIVTTNEEISNANQVTINQIFNDYFTNTSIDFLSINLNCDTLEIVRSIDFDLIPIKLITLQHNRYKKIYNTIDPFHQFLLSKNFERKFIDVVGLVESNEKFNQPYEDWFYNKSFFN